MLSRFLEPMNASEMSTGETKKGNNGLGINITSHYDVLEARLLCKYSGIYSRQRCQFLVCWHRLKGMICVFQNYTNLSRNGVQWVQCSCFIY